MPGSERGTHSQDWHLQEPKSDYLLKLWVLVTLMYLVLALPGLKLEVPLTC